MSLSPRGSLVACACLIAGACADPAGLSTRPAARPSANVARASRVVYPNSRKYRDAGFHPAFGRAGSATVSSRALLGRAGTTEVEVTTGTFDDATPAAGSLASVQVKAFDHGGRLAFTSNHTALQGGGSASWSYSALHRGDSLQLQAVVRGIDGTRSDVVTLSDAVHLRPDLVAVRIAGPQRAFAGQPVVLEGYVTETLGDLGARASCVLYVDGSPADRADGIWVDAHGTVACQMSHRFTDAGVHALELRVENVTPGDFDDSNNRATSSIQIVAPRAFLAYGLYASSEYDNTSFRDAYLWDDGQGTRQWYDQTTSYSGQSQYASINGVIAASLAWPIHVSGQMSTNGATIDAIDGDESGEYIEWQPGYCTFDFNGNGGGSVYICTYTGGYLAGYTTVQYDFWGADVQYHNDRWVADWDPSGEAHWTYTPYDWTVRGPMYPFGSDFTARVAVQGATDDVPTVASATVALEPFSYDWLFAYQPCEATSPSTKPCSEAHFTATGIMGWISYGDWPAYTP